MCYQVLVILANTFRRLMSYTPGPSAQSTGLFRSRRSRFEYHLPPYVVNPLGTHQATIVLLHGIKQEGSCFLLVMDTLSGALPNVKWICPTAPPAIIPTDGFAWFEVYDLSDIEALDANAAYVMSLVANEPRGVKIGVGGFCMGAALAMYCATCFAGGKYGNGKPFKGNLNVVFGISGWLPCSEDLSSKIGVDGGARRAASLPILLFHGTGDDVVSYKLGVQAAEELSASGFQNLAFKSYATSGHRIVMEVWSETCRWLISKLGFERPQSQW